jgi:hypothetical protein
LPALSGVTERDLKRYVNRTALQCARVKARSTGLIRGTGPVLR